MKRVLALLGTIASLFFINSSPALAASSSISDYTNQTLQIITLITTSAATFFLVKGGYLYITSTGKPDALENAKKTIRNAIIGLVIVLGANLIVNLFTNALNPTPNSGNLSAFALTPITTVKPSDGLTQVLIDAVSSFLQNIAESATKPIVDGIMTFLTNTPSLLNNSVILKFWLIMLGIVNSLFVLIVALLGLRFMSASTFGFDEIELKQLLPRIGFAMLAANVSLFLADYAIVTCNALVNAVLDSTSGLNHAWIVNAISLQNVANQTTPLITLIFLIIFLILAVVLLLMYISRLIMIALFAVLSPFIFLLWALPKFSDFADMAIRTYLVTVFLIFVHVVIIQLASSFLTLPENSINSLLSIAIAIGLLFTLLKTPSLMMQMLLYTTNNSMFKKLGGQIINVVSSNSINSNQSTPYIKTPFKTPRRMVAS